MMGMALLPPPERRSEEVARVLAGVIAVLVLGGLVTVLAWLA